MPTPTLPRLQPFDTAPHHRAKGKVLVHLHRRSTRCIIMHPVYVVCISPGFRTGGTDRGGGEREKGCTHIRRRRASRIVSRTYEQAREKAGEGQKGSWNPSPPPFGRDSIRGERQTDEERIQPFFPSPSHQTTPSRPTATTATISPPPLLPLASSITYTGPCVTHPPPRVVPSPGDRVIPASSR